MHFASCCQFLHPKTRCSGKNQIYLTIWRWIHGKYWRTYPLNIELKDTGLQVLIFRQALVQEMKDYLHDLFTRMSVAGKRGRHSGIEVMSLRVAFIIPVYKNRGSDSRWVTREIVIFLWVWWQLKRLRWSQHTREIPACLLKRQLGYVCNILGFKDAKCMN